MLFTLTTFAGKVELPAEPSDSTKISTTERLVDKYGGKIIDGFNTVVEKATPVAKQGFEIAVRLQIAKGVACLLPIIFFFIFSYSFKKEYERISSILDSDKVPLHMDKSEGPMDEDNMTAKLLIYLLMSIVLFILSCIFTYTAITHLIAPEWFAIKEIIELIK